MDRSVPPPEQPKGWTDDDPEVWPQVLRDRWERTDPWNEDQYAFLERYFEEPPLSLEEAVPGSLVDTPSGSAFLTEERLSARSKHGVVPLSLFAEQPPEVLVALGRDPDLAAVDHRSVVFLDIETTGLAGGAGTYVFMVGLGFFEDEDFVLRQYLMHEMGYEEPMLHSMNDLFSRFDAVVTYNGKCFDIPCLETRYIFSRIPFRLGDSPHLDLLHPTRRLWRKRLGGASLPLIEREVLGLTRVDDIPGPLAPQIYGHFVRTGNARPLTRVFYHNRLDVLSLASLGGILGEAARDPVGSPFVRGEDFLGAAATAKEMGSQDLAIRCCREALDSSIPPPLRFRAQRELSLSLKRRGEWESACVIWNQMLEEPFHVFPYVELAKAYEHRLRRYKEALQIVEQAIGRVELSAAPSGYSEKEDALSTLHHRRERLLRKAMNGLTSQRAEE